MGFGQSLRVFVQAGKISYERIGLVVLTNLLWFVVGFAPFLLVIYVPFQNFWFFWAGMGATIFTLGGATVAVHFVMNRIIAGEETSIVHFRDGFKKFFKRGSALTLLAILGFTILVFNIYFGLAYENRLITVLIGLWFWGILYWYAVLQFAFPFLVQQDIKLFTALKRASLVTLDNIVASAVFLLMGVAVILLSIVLAFPAILFSTSFLALLQNCALNGIMSKYEALE